MPVLPLQIWIIKKTLCLAGEFLLKIALFGQLLSKSALIWQYSGSDSAEMTETGIVQGLWP